MDLIVDLGLTSSLHLHASGALTFCTPGDDAPGCEEDAPVLSVEA